MLNLKHLSFEGEKMIHVLRLTCLPLQGLTSQSALGVRMASGDAVSWSNSQWPKENCTFLPSLPPFLAHTPITYHALTLMLTAPKPAQQRDGMTRSERRKSRLKWLEMQEGFFSSTGFGWPLNYQQRDTERTEYQRISTSKMFSTKYMKSEWNLTSLQKKLLCFSQDIKIHNKEEMYRVIQCLQEHKSFWAAHPAFLYFCKKPQLAHGSGHVPCLLADTKRIKPIVKNTSCYCLNS